MADNDHKQDDTYSEAETIARRDAALKRMLATPPRPQKEMTKEAERKRAR